MSYRSNVFVRKAFPGRDAKVSPPVRGRARSWQRGFTLLEAVIAMAIFAFVMSGLAMLMISSMRLNSNAKRFASASALAQAKVEDLRAAGYSVAVSSTANESLNLTGGTTGVTLFTRSWTVTNNSPLTGAKTVVVTVSWTDNQGTHSVPLQTILTN